MTQFFSKRLSSLTPYTPGEQPVDKKYVKLNTNENPYPPSKKALDYAAAYTRSLNLYPDPVCGSLIRSVAASEGLTPEETIVTNGSDEILNFAFMAFCDDDTPAAHSRTLLFPLAGIPISAAIPDALASPFMYLSAARIFCSTVYFIVRDIKLPLKSTGFVFFQCLLQGEHISFAQGVSFV